MTEPTSGCTIDGAPAVVIRIAELNDLTARLHQAEAAARITPDNPRPATASETDQPAEEECCGSEPPADGTWGDCWCTLPSDHDGDCRCEPCTERHGAPGWNTDDTPDASGDAADIPAVAAPATADDGLRERVAAAIRDYIGDPCTPRFTYGITDAVLAALDTQEPTL